MHRDTLKELVAIRLKEAGYLFERECFSGAYYLAGYAVECAFKVILTHHIQSHTIPEKKWVEKFHTHEFSKLINLANLAEKFKDKKDHDDQFAAAWESVEKWNPESRYEVRPYSATIEVADYDGVRHVAGYTTYDEKTYFGKALETKSLIEAVHIVLPWIKSFWCQSKKEKTDDAYHQYAKK
jgi:hypothetical protein